MKGIYNYIPEANRVSRVHGVAAVVYLQFVLHVLLFHMLNIFCTLTSNNTTSNRWWYKNVVFILCTELLRYFTNSIHITTHCWVTKRCHQSHSFLQHTSPLITVCTTRFNVKNNTFCPHNAFVCFVWVSEQTAIIACSGFVAERECVYCAVRGL